MRRLFSASRSNRQSRHNDTLDIIPSDIESIYQSVRPYTMTSQERVWALVDSVRYTIRRDIPGAFVECGVWHGGSVMAILLALLEMGISDRDIYLFDTFEGMTAPTEHDTSNFGPPASEMWAKAASQGKKFWHAAFNKEVFNLSKVRSNLEQTGYPAQRLHFIEGPVERTLPDHAPKDIALLRLDTDWYESTQHELLHLYPRLQTSGVLLIDDYGHWNGCRRAVDEYFAQEDVAPVLLSRIDYTGRIAIKT